MLKVGVQQGAASGGDTLILVLTENPGEAKVTEFDDLLFGDENVFRFDISMDALKKKKKQGKWSHCTENCADTVKQALKRDCVFWTRPPC